LSAIKNYACGLIYYLAGEYDTSLLRFKETLKLDPEFPLIRFHSPKKPRNAAYWIMSVGR